MRRWGQREGRQLGKGGRMDSAVARRWRWRWIECGGTYGEGWWKGVGGEGGQERSGRVRTGRVAGLSLVGWWQRTNQL